MRDKLKTATAGGSTTPSPPAAPNPAAAPVTTNKDVEQNTYTSERSQQLREGNVAHRSN